MPWIDNKTKTIKSIDNLIVASFSDYEKLKTWWFLAKPNQNKKYRYPHNLLIETK